MTKNHSAFWTSVRELAALRKTIPEERRALSGVRRAMAEDVLPKRPIEGLPLTDAAHVRLSMVEFFSYPFKNPVEYLDAADRIIRAAVEFGVSTRAFLGMLMETR